MLLRVCSTSLENYVGKGEISHNKAKLTLSKFCHLVTTKG